MTRLAGEIRWVPSTYSSGDGGQCVEWGPAYARTHGAVPVRDSKNPEGPVIMLSRDAWAGLVDLARQTAH
ncbi:DUF397 domain-containing protein [Streptomyces uncialis]|uniref:DUF397 domain-containing protein n=1 Tax=Streptomyces uncialis TaxID=1048205 RepID=UPI0022554431|nr:DUF397 domain-containing protein [Streptomyces uncialis]MCX4663488.1 DUF397 domain-containing protein [Streptomyces uncialis]